MKTTHLQISGPDAETFLQGQCTCDVAQLSEKKAVFSACCNRKGRMVANFWIWREGDVFYMELPSSMQETLITHLQTYVVFSKVTLEAANEHPALLEKTDLTPIWILPATSEQFTPQMINLQKHGGVSFTKGCYVGQEIIARSEHLGTLKRHVYQVTVDSNAIPTVGDDITNAEHQKMGTIVLATKKEVYAVLEDRAIDQPLQWTDHRVTLKK